MTADVIEGPWKKSDKSEKELEKARILADCDSIASDCVVAVLQSLVESDMAPEDPDDENIVYLLTGKEVGIDNSKQYYVDYHAVQNAVEYLRKNGKDPA